MTAVVYVVVDIAGQAIYVGATRNLKRRLAEHRSKAWWPLAHEVEEYPQNDWRLALFVERKLIRHLSPEFNRQSVDSGVQAVTGCLAPHFRTLAEAMAG